MKAIPGELFWRSGAFEYMKTGAASGESRSLRTGQPAWSEEVMR